MRRVSSGSSLLRAGQTSPLHRPPSTHSLRQTSPIAVPVPIYNEKFTQEVILHYFQCHFYVQRL
jgi:hypothetical protein